VSSVHIVFTGFVYSTGQTAILSVRSINQLVFVKDEERSLREATKFLNTRLICLILQNVPKSDVEVATFGKILGNFSPIVPPSAAGARLRHFRRDGHLVAVGTF